MASSTRWIPPPTPTPRAASPSTTIGLAYLRSHHYPVPRPDSSSSSSSSRLPCPGPQDSSSSPRTRRGREEVVWMSLASGSSRRGSGGYGCSRRRMGVEEEGRVGLGDEEEEEGLWMRVWRLCCMRSSWRHSVGREGGIWGERGSLDPCRHYVCVCTLFLCIAIWLLLAISSEAFFTSCWILGGYFIGQRFSFLVALGLSRRR